MVSCETDKIVDHQFLEMVVDCEMMVVDCEMMRWRIKEKIDGNRETR